MRKEVKEIQSLKEVTDYFYLAMVDADPLSVAPELYSIIGKDKFEQILELFGGMKIEIPSKDKLKKAVVSAAVWRDHSNNVSVNDIMERYGLTLRKVTKILNRWVDVSKAASTIN